MFRDEFWPLGGKKIFRRLLGLPQDSCVFQEIWNNFGDGNGIRDTQARDFLPNLFAVNLLNETHGYLDVKLHEKQDAL